MADPLLNTLCSICHISTPKYTCPGCNSHTCSLECNKKHKSWANCSGKRDPTAYMPASKLKTAAGVDHDYNFLSAIERERERNQREIVDERKLFSEKELGQLDDPYSFRKQWFGENVHFHPVSNAPRLFGSDGEDSDGDEGEGRSNRRNIPAKASQLTRHVRQRLAFENVQVVQMPVGMTRQRENTTSWNRKTRRINWCVEWIVYGDGGDQGEELKERTRIRHKALETTPLYKALGNSMAWYKRGQQADDDVVDDEEIELAQAGRHNKVLIHEVKESRHRGGSDAMQEGESAAWPTRTQYPTQNPFTGAWASDAGASATSWLADAEVEACRRHRFYLLRPLTVAGKPRELIPVGATEELGAALRGRTVLEFPTIYVLPPSEVSSTTEPESLPLPEGHILGSTERRATTKRQSAAAKRKAGPKDDSARQPSHKRQAVGKAGIPLRPSAIGDRALRGRGRSRGGRLQGPGRQRGGDQDAEEGEVNSDGDEVLAPPRASVAAGRADTSSSDPDSSSDGDGEEGDGRDAFWAPSRPPPGGGVDDDDGDGPPEEEAASAPEPAPAPAKGIKRKPGAGLVDYGSDSEDESGGDDGDGDIDDLAALRPENPELVAGAIQEIVGLLS
ncbi:hypothetical protein UCDDA912_g03422 [Diaporthe ampelina]|uniref:Box C/D snoRNA protein 1 n=1 Tax=Diaporthe ampelina TaxID=1214573 RepID=A0A0G2FQN4_9PEZI|nr:hypothetical protein UCDDA912_g03422 [Diaporthe ampelina]